MSSIAFQEIECSHCHRMLKFTMFESLNTTLDPQYKPKVLDLSLFDVSCPDCGNTMHARYGFLYHDMDRRYMISVHWDQEDLFKPSDPAEKNLMRDLGSNKPYRFRHVLGYDQLREKIRIFDAGLNDYVVEYWKFFFKKEKGIPDDLELFFQSCQNDHLYFTDPDNGIKILRVSLDQYLEILDQLTAAAPREDDYRFVHECLFRGSEN